MPAVSVANAYADAGYAEAYATLGFPGTYYLAYRDLPAIIAAQVKGKAALDFGCGAGRSTRFLKTLGFAVIGIDISPRMIALAREADPGDAGAYRLVADGDFSSLEPGGFDLVLSAFVFDNVPEAARRVVLLRGLGELLRSGGRAVVVASTPEIYTHEWASFSTRDFPENRAARSGDAVRIVLQEIADRRPVVDCLWTHEDYLRVFADSGLTLLTCHRPLGRPDEPYRWQAELAVAPWVIYVLARSQVSSSRGGDQAG